MANKIAGLTIEIGGETTGLNKALSGVNKQSKDLQSELRQVERLIKLDPKNTELLAQKQKLLSESVDTTSKKLETLKEAERQAQEQFKKGDIAEDQYRAIQREVIKTKQSLEKLEGQLKETNNKWKSMGDSLNKTGKKMKDVGGSMSAKVTAPIVAGAAIAVEGTREFRQELAKLETNAEQAGANIDITKQALKDLNVVSQDGGANVEALSNFLQAGFTDQNLADVVNELSGAVIKFPDTLKIEGLADGLQETLATGEAIGPFAELLERMGVNLDTFNEGLAKATENGEQQNFVLQELSKLGLAEVNEAYRKNNEEMVNSANAQYDLTEATAELGEKLEPILTTITQITADLLDKFNKLSPTTQKVIGFILALAAAIGPLLIVLGSAVSIVGTLTTAAGAMGVSIAAIAGPIAIAIAAITAIIAIGVTLYRNWDDIKAKARELSSYVSNKFSEMKTNTVNKFNEIKNGITDKINDARDAVKRAIEKMKSFFDFKWELPKIKLPHFKIKGEFSLNPPSVPKLGVDWYDKGGVFKKPGIIGVAEKRPEFVGALDDLRYLIADELRKHRTNYTGAAGITVQNMYVRNDSDVKKIAYEFDRLQKESSRSRGVGTL